MVRRIALSYSRLLFAEILLGAAACESPSSARGENLSVLHAGLSLARAGDMGLSKRESLARRKAFSSSMGWTEGRCFAVRQVHSRTVLSVDGSSPADLESAEADGLATLVGGCLLTVTVADCLPIFLADPDTGAFALVHSGWKGTGIVGEAVRLLQKRFGVPPSRLAATIGPGIGSCCYSVPRARFEEFRLQYGPDAVRSDGGEYFLDLRRANLSLMEEAGISDIAVVEDCTCCSAELGSFRRQGPASFTRMLAFLGPREGAGHPREKSQ